MRILTKTSLPLYTNFLLTRLFAKKASIMLLFLITSQVCCVRVFAQSKNITGIVKNENGQSLEGVSVILKGTTIGTSTDNQGKFSLQLLVNKGTLVFSYVGFATQEILLKDQTTINVQLVSEAAALKDVVVVGYGTQRKKDLTGSIAAVNVAEAKKVSTNDITGLLQGRAPGVAVNSDGQPGATPSVRIRGFSTFGGSAPFYVVDGVPVGTSIREFSPNDIQSITVLKDASAASIYGAAAANGVIIITTKQGE